MNARGGQGDLPPGGGPPSPPVGPPPGGQAFTPPPGPLPGTYTPTAKGPVRYLPVTLGGQVIGYLWASPTSNAAGFVRRMQSAEQAFRAPLTWSDRLRKSYAEGLAPTDALRHWIGVPEDPEGGGIAAGEEEREAANLAELYEAVNPGTEPPPESVGPRGHLPDGTPLDRSKGWGELSPFTLTKPGYSFQTDSPVRYLPVTRNGTVLGYLWASETDDAADYQRRVPAGAEGFRAGSLWISRLDQCKQEGLAPLEALRRWVGAPPDAQAGEIAADAQEHEAPSLAALKEIAQS